jgi:hypothetical protein
MISLAELKNARREDVLQSYTSARATNHRMFLEGDDKATSDYIFPNQILDAHNIVHMFYQNNRRVVSIQKKTKVGADGLMIEIVKLLTTHNDDEFVVNPTNVRIITGMSNVAWEQDMIHKAPNYMKNKIFHHGKLSSAELTNISDGLFIIDEIDTGDKECQRLHTMLDKAGVLDVVHMKENNNRFVFISATMIRELYDLYRWGELHELYRMTIPTSYVGHRDFLEMDIVKEFYYLGSRENADKWVHDDIISHYGKDYRVHLVRTTDKIVNFVQNACIRAGIGFRNHTSTERLSEEEIVELFKTPLRQHIVLGIKGFFRRANLIPNRWKLIIGATHELFTKKVDNNVQIQGLTGRMTGYWRECIEGGHKTGPHRTSIKAIEEYEKTYLNPFGLNSYHTAGFNKNVGRVSANPTMLTSKNIKNLDAIDAPTVSSGEFEREEFERGHSIFVTQAENESYAKELGAKRISKYDTDDNGYKMCSTTSRRVHTLEEILKFTTNAKLGSNLDKKLSELQIGEYAYRRYVCYRDVSDISSECFVTIWVKRV